MADQRLPTRGPASNMSDADLIHVVDVSDPTSDPSGTSKKLAWSTLKTVLTTAFNSVYQAVGNYVTTDTVQQINEDKGYNRSSAQIESLGDLSMVNKRYVFEQTVGNYVTKSDDQLTGLTGAKKWEGANEFTKPVTTANINVELRTATITTTYELDRQVYGVWDLTMSAATTFTDGNLIEGNLITIYMTGNFTPTFPSYWTLHPDADTYDGTLDNLILIDCRDATGSSEVVDVMIKNLT